MGVRFWDYKKTPCNHAHLPTIRREREWEAKCGVQCDSGSGGTGWWLLAGETSERERGREIQPRGKRERQAHG